jgi:general secretion pathway protein K
MTVRLPDSQRGSALLLALLAAALATVIALSMIERGQGTLARTQALLSTERAYQYALGMEILAEDLIGRVFSEGLDPTLLDGIWTPPYDVPGGMVQGRLLDQNARFNLNALAHPDAAMAALAFERFERLLDHLGLNPVIAAELADWISAARTPRPGSAGDSWYGARQPPYRMAGTRLGHVSELRWLRSVDQEAYERLIGSVTALPDVELVININTTSPLVLASLVAELDLDQARRVLADGPFGDVRGFMQHPVIQTLATPTLERHLNVTSRWYLAQARVVLDDVERDYFRLMQYGGSGYDFRLFSQGVP